MNESNSRRVLSCVEEWIARWTVELRDTGSNPARSLDDNQAKKITLFEDFLHPFEHYNHAFAFGICILPRICILQLHITTS